MAEGRTKIRAIFRVLGDALCPEEVSKSLDICPTSSKRKGVPYPKRPHIKAFTGSWILDTPLDKMASFEKHLEYFLDLLSDKTEALSKLRELGLMTGLHFGIFSLDGSEGYIHLDPGTLHRISVLGLELDLFYYDVSEGEEELGSIDK